MTTIHVLSHEHLTPDMTALKKKLILHLFNKQLNNFNRKITNDLELPQYRRQSDRRTWGSPS